MAGAAQAWLDSLDAEQRGTAVGHPPADDATDAERRRWFYTPTDHGGLTVHQQRPDQHRAVMRLISTGLSTPAYVTVATIMGLEYVLDQLEGFVTRFDRVRGRGVAGRALSRRRRAGPGVLRLGRSDRRGATALLPAAGAEPADRVDNTQRSANHAHSVWRDPATDFGMDVLAGHRAAHRH